MLVNHKTLSKLFFFIRKVGIYEPKVFRLKKLYGWQVIDFLKDLPKDLEIEVCTGGSGITNSVQLEVNEYENLKADVYLNIEAESGYVY